jgi:hypothetical protein
MFYDLLGGVTKLEAFQCYFVTKLYPLKPSPFLKSEINGKQEQPASKQIGLLKTFLKGSSKPRGQQHAQEGTACPRGSSMHGGSSMPRGSSKASGEQHAKGEQHKRVLHISLFHEIENKLV